MPYREIERILVEIRDLLLRKWDKAPGYESSEDPTDKKGATKPKSPSHTYNHYCHPSEEEHRTYEQINWRYSFWLNVGVALIAIVGALYARGAYIQTKRQAVAAEDTLRDTKNASRPYLMVHGSIAQNASGTSTTSLKYQFLYQLTNYGTTPAIVTDPRSYIRTGDEFSAIDTAYSSAINTTGFDGSVKDTVIRANEFNTAFSRDIPASNKKPVYIIGRVLYQDFFGDRFTIKFCYVVALPDLTLRETRGGKHCQNSRT